MKTVTFNCNDYASFVEQFESVFLKAGDKIQFVECPVRMGKTYTAERYIIKVLKREIRNEREVILFCTEKNLLVDSSFLEIKEKLLENQKPNLLVFKKETSEKSLKSLKEHLLGENFKIACLCSFTYVSSEQISDLVSSIYESGANVTTIIDEGECLLNTLIKDVPISRCVDRRFGTKVKGNLSTSLDRSKNTLSHPGNENVTNSHNSFVYGSIRAEPGPYNTYELFKFVNLLRTNEPCLDIKIHTGKSFYEDFTVFKEVKTVDVILKSEIYNIFEITKDFKIKFNDRLFRTIERAKEIDFVIFYTLIALIDRVIKCNSLYIKFPCVTSPVDGFKVMSYKEAGDAYADYKSAKSTNKKEKLSNYLVHKEVNPLYEMKLCFNEIEPLTRLVKISSSLIFLSGTWNKWLLDLFFNDSNPDPFFTNISDVAYVSRNDLLKLKYLILTNDVKLENDIYINPDSSLSELEIKFNDKDIKNIAKLKNL